MYLTNTGLWGLFFPHSVQDIWKCPDIAIADYEGVSGTQSNLLKYVIVASAREVGVHVSKGSEYDTCTTLTCIRPPQADHPFRWGSTDSSRARRFILLCISPGRPIGEDESLPPRVSCDRDYIFAVHKCISVLLDLWMFTWSFMSE